MALKRIVSREVADDKTYEKLKRDRDILPPSHAGRGRKTAELNAAKARMAARRV